jgi:Methenyl tetrahydrofolate cyclohydrolase
MLIELPVDEFLEKAASGSPTPGGGSVCALAGALGAALSSMVGELSVKKDIDSGTRAEIEDAMGRCKGLMEDLKRGVDDDTHAFNGVIAALKMPKTNDEEKAIRTGALQNALKEASELPYETAEKCLEVMSIALSMLGIGNKNAASDASVSGYLAYAALNGALYNVKINLNSIKDEEFVRDRKVRMEELSLRADGILQRIKELSAQIIG